MAKVFALFNQSGGVGKTTMTMNLGHLASQRTKDDGSSYRVLLLDMDPQASLTAFHGIDPYTLEETTYTALVNKKTPAVVSINGYDIAPTNLTLSMADMELMSAIRREDRLKDCLKKLQDDYDLMLIDCPPGLTLVSLMSLMAASYLLIPIQTEFKSVQATVNLLQTTAQIVQEGNPELKVCGVMPTLHNERINQAKRALESIQATFEQLKGNSTFSDTVVYDPIPRRTDVANASAERVPLALYRANHEALKPMNLIVDHILELL